MLLLFNTTRARTLSGPPSTRATVAMDGGVADTARAFLCNPTSTLDHEMTATIYNNAV